MDGLRLYITNTEIQVCQLLNNFDVQHINKCPILPSESFNIT